jgi:hypothetical protein
LDPAYVCMYCSLTQRCHKKAHCGGHVHALDRVRGVRGALIPMTCAVLFHTPVCSHVCMRPALCGPHAYRIVWPACKPAASDARWRSRLHPCGLLARAWARPESGSGTLRAFPASPPACRPSRLPLLSGAARPVAPPAIRLSFSPPRDSFSPPRDSESQRKLAPRLAGFSPRRRHHWSLPSLHAHACQVWGLECRHRRRQIVRDRSYLQGSVKRMFFPGSAETVPLVVLRKKCMSEAWQVRQSRYA